MHSQNTYIHQEFFDTFFITVGILHGICFPKNYLSLKMFTVNCQHNLRYELKKLRVSSSLTFISMFLMFPVFHHACTCTHTHTMHIIMKTIYDAHNYVHMRMTHSTCISAYYVFMHIFRTDEMELRNEYIGEQSLLYLM